ncbi:MAG TPA: hypothetical protein VM370_13745 [Candidatus Thermoplasmatota archaeon]|nr:hypothetical protein [Candidatus Thermoplasmatota archaeon]
MGKLSKREEAEAAKEGDYEFKLPSFDEKAFIRREVQSARASFYTIALGVAAGVVAAALYYAPIPWYVGWLPIFASIVALRPMLQRFGFSDEVTAWKALLGSLMMLFFTGLAVWILGINVF